ncbi:hypothetical protein QYE76_072033 [Lolium multiflorum]|uniref:Uncharacterized protein n=1 Tax=Lolium multiflorum TaxID=4521 RepID=A0AAD8PI56_LOLMU|nr:hypothetical protein QYE76_072033 [Lolium multiflorum]
MSTALASWRNRVKKMINSGASYEKIKESNPSITEQDYADFKITCESESTSDSSQWGKDMRKLNLGTHKLGPGGFRAAQPKWDAADEERVKNGLEPLFPQYKNKQTMNFLLARYRIDPKTKELTTTPDVKEFEALLAKEIAAEMKRKLVAFMEERRIREKDHGYPVYIAKVPSGHGFVDSDFAAKIFLRKAMRIIRDNTPGLAIADPFYMRAVHLATAERPGNADGKSSTDYTNVKAVLDDALNGYVRAKGHMERPNVRYGKHVFKHQTKFPCVKKPPSSTKDAYYALYHMNKFIRDQQQLTLPEHLRDWANKLSRVPDDSIKQDFFRIQTELCEIIHQDVVRSAGEFYAGYQPSNQ